MPAAIPYHPNGSLHRRSKAVNYAKSSRRNGRSFSVQDATLSIRLSSKWADITVQMTRFHGYIYCRDCFGHYKKEECPSPGLDGQWRCSECAEECTRARGEVIKIRVDWATLLARLQIFCKNMLRLRAIWFWEQRITGPQPCLSYDQKPRWHSYDQKPVYCNDKSWKAMFAKNDFHVVGRPSSRRTTAPTRERYTIQTMCVANSSSSDRKLVFVDSFGAHSSDEVVEEIRNNGHAILMLPGGNTSLVQPIDTNIHATFKNNFLRRD